MYSFAYRMYNPMSMRWLTVDPIKDGLNWYQYCWSDPVNWVDLLGLSTSTSEYKHPDYYLPPDGSPRAEDPLLAAKGRLQQKIREASIYQRGAGGNFNRRPPEGSKIKYTWCNQATYDYTAATSPVLFNAMTGGTDRRKASDSSYNINANAAGKKLKAAEEAGIIVEIDGATAQALANRGYTVVAVQENPNGSGQLNTIAMDLHPYDSSRGPLTSNVGGKPGDLKYADMAFLNNGEAVKYYYDPNQDLNFIEESQVLNKWNYPVREEINVKDVINEPQVPNTGGDEDKKEDKKENN